MNVGRQRTVSGSRRRQTRIRVEVRPRERDVVECGRLSEHGADPFAKIDRNLPTHPTMSTDTIDTIDTDDDPAPPAAGAPSPTCGNCGAPLHGPFCAQCGQQRRGLDMPVGTFVASAFAGLASFDSRFWRTVLPLVGRPGFLTRELIEGRRVRYVPPMRLYLFVSFVFFLTVQLTDQEIVVNTSDSSGRSVVTIHTNGTVETTESVEADQVTADASPKATSDRVVTSEAPRVAEQVDGGEAATPAAPTSVDDEGGVNAAAEAGRPDVPEDTSGPEDTNDPEDTEDPANVGELLRNAIIKLAEDPERGTDVLLRRLPVMVFLLVPLAALWLRLLFWRRQSYYVPNLVGSLHLHSAVLLLLNLSMLTEYLPGPDVLGALLVLWIPVYTLLMLKRVYGTGWWGSLWRLGVFGFVHLIALTLGLLASVVITGLSL